MQIRRVKRYDGGNHLIEDRLQYREASSEQWTTVEVMCHDEAFLQDLREGIESLDQHDPHARAYWERRLQSVDE